MCVYCAHMLLKCAQLRQSVRVSECVIVMVSVSVAVDGGVFFCAARCWLLINFHSCCLFHYFCMHACTCLKGAANLWLPLVTAAGSLFKIACTHTHTTPMIFSVNSPLAIHAFSEQVSVQVYLNSPRFVFFFSLSWQHKTYYRLP